MTIAGGGILRERREKEEEQRSEGKRINLMVNLI